MKRTLRRISQSVSRSVSPDVRQTAKSGLILALKTAKDAGDNVPGAAMIFGGILSVIEGLDKSAANVKSLQELEDQIRALKDAFFDLRTLELDDDVKKFAEKLDDHLQELEKRHRGGHLLKVVNATYDEQDILSISEHIKNSLALFQIRMIARREERENLREERERVREEQERLRELSARLEALPCAENASFNSDRPSKPTTCFQGTRTKVLEEIKAWINSSGYDDATSVFWLNGIAGIGKSTIAQSIAEEAHAEGTLVASFFFSRMEAERSSSTRVIPTIAYQLAQLDPAFKLRIGESLKDPLGHVGLSKQMERLLIEPLSKTKISKTVLIVLDALDECDNAGAEELLRLLPALLKRVSFPLRIFITSRPERHIRTTFERSSNYPKIILHKIESSIVKEDIRLYLEAMLQRISQSRSLSPDWFAKDFEKLVSLADRLFIYAATAYRFLNDDMPGPPERLKILLDPSPSSDKSAAYYSLDQLYTQVLLNALPKQNGKYLDSTLKIYQNVVGSIALLRDPLPMTALARFIDHKSSLRNEISLFHSVIVVSPQETDVAPSIYHPSFLDFITDPNRCTEASLLIDRTTHERRLTICCLKILTTQLKRDMANIRNPSLLNEEVPQLSDRVRKKFTPELRYACLHWSSHLCALPQDEEDPKLWSLLKDFTSRCMLWWIEAMSLLDHSTLSSFSIGSAHLWALSLNHDSRTTSLLHGGHRLILTHLEPIRLAALHVYHSALSFAPHGSSVWGSYQEEAKNVVQIKQGVPPQWPACMKTIFGHRSSVNSVAFSRDGLHIASGSDDLTVCLRDAMSGEQLFEMHGHTGFVNSVAFSPDGSQIVSGSNDKTVRLWDTVSGQQTAELHGHIHNVNSVAFLPDGSRIVSGSYDRTVRLWDAISGQQTTELHGHTDGITSVASSSDGLRIVSGSEDRTVRLWDAISGQSTAELRGHTRYVRSVAFSPNGSHIVSGSDDRTIRLWDAISFQQIAELRGHTGDVRSVAFSPNGSRIVSSSSDETVRLWNAISGQQTVELQGHAHIVNLAAFSPDGSRVVSGSYDRTVRLWDATSNQQTAELDSHPSFINSVAFSPDGSRIASGSDESTICLWDAISGEQLLEMYGHTGIVNSVAFSPDGSRIVSGSEDNTVRLWDVLSGQQTAELHGHTRSVSSVAFSSDGLRIVSGAYDKIVRLWDTISGQQTAELHGHTHYVTSVAFSSDGAHIVSRADNGHTVMWDLSVDPPSLLSYSHHPPEAKNLPTSPFLLKDRWLCGLLPSGLLIRVCYVPSEYEVSTEVICSGTRVCFGCEGGQLLLLDTSHHPVFSLPV